MPRPPLPAELDELVGRANPAVVATVRPDGAPHTAATWYDWESGRVLLNMDESRARLGHMRENPQISVTIFDGDDWERHVTLLGLWFRSSPTPTWRASTGLHCATPASRSARATGGASPRG